MRPDLTAPAGSRRTVSRSVSRCPTSSHRSGRYTSSRASPGPNSARRCCPRYESGHKRPGPAYLHDLCRVYRVEPGGPRLPGPCVCGRTHARRRLTGRYERRTANPTSCSDPAPSSITRSPDTTERSPSPTSPGPSTAPRTPWRSGEEEETVLRRTLLQILAGAGVALDGQILGAVDVSAARWTTPSSTRRSHRRCSTSGRRPRSGTGSSTVDAAAAPAVRRAARLQRGPPHVRAAPADRAAGAAVPARRPASGLAGPS